MTTDEFLARIQAHRNNILRYRRLLNTKLTEKERQFIFKRLSEEESALGGAALPSVHGQSFGEVDTAAQVND